MAAVAVFALATFALYELSGARKFRRENLGWAAESRLYEQRLLDAAGRFEACRSGHGAVDRDATSCPVCQKAWEQAPLREAVRTPAEAIVVLHDSAGLMAWWASRHERAAARPWAAKPPVTPAQWQAYSDLKYGDGPIHRGLFDAY
ncbi:hypothetical protein [Paludisphaera soli]|uniref:hypothetical protein n=1 Tax=Paludisphaera soli TaxID=2712865 RepID=UPI0013EA9C62|nr:hypothetical protein [Paludisphaera soli]